MIETCYYYNKETAQLTIDNVAKVEAMIRNDSAYIKSRNPDAAQVNKKSGIDIKYSVSTA